jgi:hypothetical protein
MLNEIEGVHNYRGFGIAEEHGYLRKTLELIRPQGLEATLQDPKSHGDAEEKHEQHGRERHMFS